MLVLTEKAEEWRKIGFFRNYFSYFNCSLISGHLNNIIHAPLFSFSLQDPRSKPHQYSHGSLPRNTHLAVTPDVSSPTHSPYHMQPIISRISIPPTSAKARQHKPIPLSVIMRLQNPHWGAMMSSNPRAGGEGEKGPYQPAMPMPREFFNQPAFLPQPLPPELRQPGIYSDGMTHFTSVHF